MTAPAGREAAEGEDRPGRIVSVRVALPTSTLRRGDGWVTSAIRKLPVQGRVHVGPEGLDGDGHGNPRVHGGPRKAVYAYPLEHYAYWKVRRRDLEFPIGIFGEKLTIEGISESEVRPGDVLAVGPVRLEVTQPRFPCERLGLRFERPEMVREFAEAGRPGFYLAVRTPGAIEVGMEIRRSERGPVGPTIEDIFRERARRVAPPGHVRARGPLGQRQRP